MSHAIIWFGITLMLLVAFQCGAPPQADAAASPKCNADVAVDTSPDIVVTAAPKRCVLRVSDTHASVAVRCNFTTAANASAPSSTLGFPIIAGQTVLILKRDGEPADQQLTCFGASASTVSVCESFCD